MNKNSINGFFISLEQKVQEIIPTKVEVKHEPVLSEQTQIKKRVTDQIERHVQPTPQALQAEFVNL